MSPKVSVIVPVFNLGQFLEEAIESVLDQSYQDFEILIVNDGSTDGATNELLRDYRRPKTTVFATPNRGLAAARNFLIERAQGEYLCALDADDRLRRDCLRKTTEVLDRDPGVCFVSFWLQVFGEDHHVSRQDRCDLASLLANDTVATAALVRRQAVVDAGGYDGGMGVQGYEDWELWLSLVERGHRGVILPEILFDYRSRRDSMCSVCMAPENHQRLVEYMIRKHAASYRDHLADVLADKETEVARLLEECIALRGGTAGAADDSGPARPVDEARQLQTALAAARHEIEALRTSLSWRLTAPVRLASDFLFKRRVGPERSEH